jgi:hypothetical protein
MNYRISGLLSILLSFTAIGLAVYQLFVSSLLLGFLFLFCFIISWLNTFYHYCRKCPHTNNGSCRHVIFGWITSKLFKPVPPSPYLFKEKFAQYINVFIYVLAPQYWLFKNTSLFAMYWVLMIISIILQFTSVCRKCENAYCSYRPKYKIIKSIYK